MSLPRVPINPASSTYYSHRVFMIYEPEDYRKYLGRIVAGENWRETGHARHLMTWATLLVYQARMDPFAFNECMNRYLEDAGNFRDGYEDRPDSDPMFRMQLTMQLAIEAVTRGANIESRIDETPSRAQLVFDTLYYVASQHALDRVVGGPTPHVFHVAPVGLQTYLRGRAEGDRGEGLPVEFPGPDERVFLFDRLREYLGLLGNPEEIRERTLGFARRQSDRRNGELWEALAFAILPEPVIALAESATPDEVAFRFRLDRYGVNPDEPDPLEQAAQAAEALDEWESLLRQILGDPSETARMTADARLIDRFPEWGSVEKARRGILQTAEAAEAAAVPVARGADGDYRELRRAALQLRDYLRMLGQWAAPFRVGVNAAAVAASAARTGTAVARRRIAFEALRVLCGFDARDPPEQVAETLQGQLGFDAWPAPFGQFILSSWGYLPPVDMQFLLADYVSSLSTAIRSAETILDAAPPIDWAAVWAEFWTQWRFPPTGVDAERVNPTNPSLALDLLHAVRHGAIPVMPSRSGNLSIGEWCRVLTLAWSSDEKLPERGVEAGLAALGFPESTYEPVPSRSERELPILLISVRSMRSPAWQWRPQPGVRALMLMPADVAAADGGVREESADRILSRRGLGSGRIVHCIEAGLGTRERYERVDFGFGRAPEGAERYIQDPANVADLAQQAARAERLPQGGVWPFLRQLWRALAGLAQQP